GLRKEGLAAFSLDLRRDRSQAVRTILAHRLEHLLVQPCGRKALTRARDRPRPERLRGLLKRRLLYVSSRIGPSRDLGLAKDRAGREPGKRLDAALTIELDLDRDLDFVDNVRAGHEVNHHLLRTIFAFEPNAREQLEAPISLPLQDPGGLLLEEFG